MEVHLSWASAATDTQAPSRPGAPVAITATPTTVTLTWTPSTDNVGVVQYRVDTLSINSIRTVYSTTNTATFTDLWPGGWVFAVAAFDAAGNQSQWSPSSSGISLPSTESPAPRSDPPDDNRTRLGLDSSATLQPVQGLSSHLGDQLKVLVAMQDG